MIMNLELMAEQSAATLIAMSFFVCIYKLSKMHIKSHCVNRCIDVVIFDEENA